MQLWLHEGALLYEEKRRRWVYSGLRSPPKKKVVSTPGPVCEPITVPI